VNPNIEFHLLILEIKGFNPAQSRIHTICCGVFLLDAQCAFTYTFYASKRYAQQVSTHLGFCRWVSGLMRLSDRRKKPPTGVVPCSEVPMEATFTASGCPVDNRSCLTI